MNQKIESLMREDWFGKPHHRNKSGVNLSILYYLYELDDDQRATGDYDLYADCICRDCINDNDDLDDDDKMAMAEKIATVCEYLDEWADPTVEGSVPDPERALNKMVR